MPLKLLPNKSWHVWNEDNMIRVERDEKEHKEREERKAQQAHDAEVGSKLDALEASQRRQQALLLGGSGEGGRVMEPRSDQEPRRGSLQSSSQTSAPPPRQGRQASTSTGTYSRTGAPTRERRHTGPHSDAPKQFFSLFPDTEAVAASLQHANREREALRRKQAEMHAHWARYRPSVCFNGADSARSTALQLKRESQQLEAEAYGGAHRNQMHGRSRRRGGGQDRNGDHSGVKESFWERRRRLRNQQPWYLREEGGTGTLQGQGTAHAAADSQQGAGRGQHDEGRGAPRKHAGSRWGRVEGAGSGVGGSHVGVNAGTGYGTANGALPQDLAYRQVMQESLGASMHRSREDPLHRMRQIQDGTTPHVEAAPSSRLPYQERPSRHRSDTSHMSSRSSVSARTSISTRSSSPPVAPPSVSKGSAEQDRRRGRARRSHPSHYSRISRVRSRERRSNSSRVSASDRQTTDALRRDQPGGEQPHRQPVSPVQQRKHGHGRGSRSPSSGRSPSVEVVEVEVDGGAGRAAHSGREDGEQQSGSYKRRKGRTDTDGEGRRHRHREGRRDREREGRRKRERDRETEGRKERERDREREGRRERERGGEREGRKDRDRGRDREGRRDRDREGRRDRRRDRRRHTDRRRHSRKDRDKRR